MKDFYDKDEYSYSDIESLINDSVEESLYLDFKSSAALAKTDGKRSEISKDVSSFANSQGGIIIYGVNEENHIASSISFIDGNQFTKEWLEHVINSNVQRRIQDITIFPIRKNNDISKTIYLVKIPYSLNAPHQSKNKKFHKRFNYESVPMDEHEIRELYGRRLNSKLVISNWTLLPLEYYYRDRHEIIAEVTLTNIGEIPESEYKVNVTFDKYLPGMEIVWDNGAAEYTRMPNDRMKVSNISSNKIFPNEAYTGLRFIIKIKNSFDISMLNSIKVTIHLYYENEVDEMVTDMLGLDKLLLEIENNTGENA